MPQPVHTPIAFYFDFISPFGYFASRRIDALAAKYERKVDWHSMLLGISVLKVMGLPAVTETPLKSDYVARSAMRYARLHDVPINRSVIDSPMSPLLAGRAFWWLKKRDADVAQKVAKDMLQAYWGEVLDMSDPEAIAAVAASHGVDAVSFIAGMQSAEAKDLLRTAVNDSIQKGVFGSPFFIVDGEAFFGADNLEHLELWLERGGW